MLIVASAVAQESTHRTGSYSGQSVQIAKAMAQDIARTLLISSVTIRKTDRLKRLCRRNKSIRVSLPYLPGARMCGIS